MYPGAIAKERPDAVAYVMAASGQAVTYRELDEESNRLARLFRERGLRRGDHIAFCLENHVRLLQVSWAAQRSGLYYTAISPRLALDEAAYVVTDCGAKVFVTSVEQAGLAEDLRAVTPLVQHRFMLDGTAEGYESLEAAMAGEPAEPLPDESEGADMLYSSGTTGRPKGIKRLLPEGGIGESPGFLPLMQQLFGFDERTVYLSPAPLYHSAPIRFCMAMHRLGATAVVMERFDPEAALAAIERYRVTHSQWVPTMFIRMLKLPEAVREKYDLSSHRCCIHGAAPCPAEVKERMIEWWGPIVHEYYGGTEGNGVVYCNAEQWLAHRGTVGRPIAGEVHVCDEGGNVLPPGETGTIWFGGLPDFEYHNDTTKTEQSRHPSGNGWSTLGDIGLVDEEGFVYLTDRHAFTIVSGGVNIYPQEIENVLVVHPQVADVAVFGVPNDDLGEEVKAVVQPMDPSEAGPELAAALLDFCRSRLAHVKCPRSIDFRQTLPRDPSGKLVKRIIRDEYWQGRRTRIGN